MGTIDPSPCLGHGAAAARLPASSTDQRLGGIAGLAKLQRTDKVSAGEGS